MKKSIHGWDYDTSFDRRRIDTLLDKEVIDELQKVFGHLNAEDSWNKRGDKSTVRIFC